MLEAWLHIGGKGGAFRWLVPCLVLGAQGPMRVWLGGGSVCRVAMGLLEWSEHWLSGRA